MSNHISVSRYDLLWIYVSCIYNLFCTILTEHLWITGKIGVLYSNYSKIVTQLIAASAAGILATKLKRSTKPMIVAGVVGAGLYIVMEILPASTAVMWPMLVVMTVALMMIYVFRALYYATVDEEGTPKNIVGSVIGISSLIGFIPDTFYTSLCGKWLEARSCRWIQKDLLKLYFWLW